MVSSRRQAIPRLGVAAYGWWNEAAHGVAREQTNDGDNPPDLTNTTSYPVSLSLGATWNPGLVYREASLISDEAREVVRDNRYDLDFYSPTVNLARDPRWGRNDETFGEDPLLTGALAAQYVNGMQGQTENGESQQRLPQDDRHDQALRGQQQRVEPAERLVRHGRAHAARVLHGPVPRRDQVEPSGRDHERVQQRQRRPVGGQRAPHRHARPADLRLRRVFHLRLRRRLRDPGRPELAAARERPLDQYGRTAYAQSAGEDLNCDMGYHDEWNYANTIPTAVQKRIRTATGVYNENDVDVSVVRLFTARIALGEFDAESRCRGWPRRGSGSRPARGRTPTPTTRSPRPRTGWPWPRNVADESIVLLKNQNAHAAAEGTEEGGRSWAVTPTRPRCTWAATPATRAVPVRPMRSPRTKASRPRSRRRRSTSCPASCRARSTRSTRARSPRRPRYDAVVVCAGTDDATASEDNDRTSLALPGAQAELISQVAAANPHTIVYLETVGQVDCRRMAPAILWSSYNGQRRARRWPTCSPARSPRAAGCRSPGTPTRTSSRRSRTTRSGRPRPRSGARTSTSPARVTFPFGYGLSYTSFQYTGLRVGRHAGQRDGHQHRRPAGRRRRPALRDHTGRAGRRAAPAQTPRRVPEGHARAPPERPGHVHGHAVRPRVLRREGQPLPGRPRAIRVAAGDVQRR